MDTKQLAKIATLQERKAQIKREEKAINSELADLQPLMLEAMDEEGVESLRVRIGTDDDGSPIYKTVYQRRELWAGHENGRDNLATALKEAGLNEYVSETFNAQSLSAYVRAFDPENKLSPEEIKALLPKAIQDQVKISEKREIRSRR